MIKNILLIGLLTLLIMLVIDFVWLKFIISDFFFGEIGHIANPGGEGFEVNKIAAIFTYVLMTVAIVVFVLPLAQSKTQALMYGALLGFILYGVFDGTNLAIIKDYSLKFAVVDIIWGTIIASIGSISAFLFQNG